VGVTAVDERLTRAEQARAVAARLGAQGVRGVALTWVDNAGLTRVKTVPLARLEAAATWGVGMSPVFDVFLVDDSATSSTHIGGPSGDLRLYPDLSRLTPLHAQPGWAWAPADRYTQEGDVHVACQRSFAARLTDEARRRGLQFRMAFEVEWFLGRPGESTGEAVPVGSGPAYGMARLVEVSDYARDLLVALERQGLEVEQFHPEYASGQLEVSVAATDPVAAADLTVLVRQTIRGVAARHGLAASFAPIVTVGQVGNGAHLHLSAWSEGRNLMTGGPGRYGLTARGESLLAGLLEALPALVTVGAPSVASYLRLVPSHWAGVFQCWGRENREAAIRLVTGTAGNEPTAANAEVKCLDASANPYLLVGSVVALALSAVDEGRRLPDEVTGDPAGWAPEELARRAVNRLPQSLPEALEHLQRATVLRAAMGEALFDAFVAVRRAEVALFAGRSAEEVVAATRWRH
jgi:glutamine synthetase